MPKNRKRANQNSAKSTSIRTKHKIGGRKSGIGAKQTPTKELRELLKRVSKRDHNMLVRILAERGAL